MSAVRGSAFCRDIISAVMGICPGASDYWLPWPSRGGWGMSLINILIFTNILSQYLPFWTGTIVTFVLSPKIKIKKKKCFFIA